MLKRLGKAMIATLTLVASLAFIMPTDLACSAYVSGGVESSAASIRVNLLSSMKSLAFAEEPELWRFFFTRFMDVPSDLAYQRAPTSIALDSSNFPHISYAPDQPVYRGLRHVFYNGTRWITETVDNSFPLESDIAVDSRDYAHVTYTVYSDGSYDKSLARVKYAYYDGNSWVTDALNESGFWSNIALDSQDNPHIAYFDGSGLQYAFFNGFKWTKETVDRDSLNGLSIPSIALDSENQPHIAYSGGLTVTPRPLKYATLKGLLWNIQTIDEEGYAASLIIASSNNIHISYRNATALKYAYFDGASWNIEVVATNIGGGVQTSLAIDSESRPHIVYQSGTVINHAYFGYKSWNITAINEDKGYDPGPWGSGGWYSSFAYYSPSLGVGSDNKLHVSYIAGKYGSELRYGVGTKQYLTNFEFNDDSGNALYTAPSSIRIKCPIVLGLPSNSLEFTTFSNQWLDSGSWTSEKVMWQGSDVKPVGDVTYAPVPGGTWKVQTGVYALNIKNIDQFGNLLTQSVTLTFPNGTSFVNQPIQGWINMTQVQNGTILINTPISISKSERYVLLSPTSIILTKNTVVDSMSWRHEITTLKVSLGSSTTYVGFYVNITGRLTHIPAGDIPEAIIILTYRVLGVPEWDLITSTLTKSDGTYNVIWIPSATGYYTINASWNGTDEYLGADSIVNLGVVPFDDEYVFSVASNSTISALSFDSTSRELSFTVSGPSGTTGYIDATVAKTLISDIADVKVFLDGEETTYTATDKNDSWLLHFTYTHSTHTVTIRLGSIPIPIIPPQLITPLSLGLLAVALAVATVILIFKMRKGTPPTILDSVFRKAIQG